MPRPFLKWAGGKGQLLPELRARVAAAGPFECYHEPFVGGGALFFDLYRGGALGTMTARLSDGNPRLIEVYQAVQNDVDRVIQRLVEHSEKHGKEYYYTVRAEVPDTLPERAARIIYLNRTCFNGLYRENSRGEFNVPFGDYKNPRICDAENLRAAAKALKKARITAAPFASVLDSAKPGDFVYFDPPYHPVSATASFTAYAQGGFGEADQRRLAGVFAELTLKGVKALLSNSWAPLILDLYSDFIIDQVHATRNVNSVASGRGVIPEALIRNY